MNLIMKLTIKNNITTIGILLLVILSSLPSCKKLIAIDAPYTSINQENVYASNSAAISVLTGIYSDMSNTGPFSGFGSIGFYGGLSADEFTLYSGVSEANLHAYYQNKLKVLNPSNTFGSENWAPIYNFIFRSNAAIAGLEVSNTLTPAVKQQLLGEAEFLRALYYFYLVNLYGNVPLVLSTDYKTNSTLSRATKAQVYQQIIADLKSSQSLMSVNFLNATLTGSTTERVRPTKWAATALLARVYLYYGYLTGDATNFQDAITQSTTVINNTGLFSLDTLNGAFLKNSSEAIWQLQPINFGYNTLDGQLYNILSVGPTDYNYGGNPVYLSNNLLNAFEPGDQRRTNWVDSVAVNGTTYYYPYKYKNFQPNSPVTEYLMILRLGEQYLIRAEAEAKIGSGNALADMNLIRNRAGLPNYSVGGTGLLQAIMHERQIELFSEFGHRWLDLKRIGAVDSVMVKISPQKGSAWNSYQQLYPIPLSDIERDQKLVQNPGY
jgi:hypothetical protein